MNAPAAFRMLWGMVVPFLEPRTQAKVHILGSNLTQLQDYVPADELEASLGGTHAPYPFPDRFAASIAQSGATIHSGLFDHLVEESGNSSGDDAPAGGGGGADAGIVSRLPLAKASSIARLGYDRVRAWLPLLDSSVVRRATTAAASMKPIEVPKAAPRATVFGATGRTGLLVVKLLLAAGYEVAAFVRVDGHGVPPALLKLSQEYGSERLQIVVGALANERDLDRAVESSDAVVSCIGGERTFSSSADWFVTTGDAILDALERNGTKRLVLVSAGQARRMSKAWTFDTGAPLSENAARAAYWSSFYAHLAELEKRVLARKAAVEFTFARPYALDDSASDAYVVEDDAFFVSGGALPRAALAKFIVDECVVSRKHVGRGVAISGAAQ